jgi:hypothetical protein
MIGSRELWIVQALQVREGLLLIVLVAETMMRGGVLSESGINTLIATAVKIVFHG